MPLNSLKISNKLLTDGFFAICGMSRKAQEIKALISRLPELGNEGVRLALIEDVRMLPCKCESLLDFFSSKGDNENTMAYLEMFRGMDESFDKGLDALKKTLTENDDCSVDLTLLEGREGENGMVYK